MHDSPARTIRPLSGPIGGCRETATIPPPQGEPDGAANQDPSQLGEVLELSLDNISLQTLMKLGDQRNQRGVSDHSGPMPKCDMTSATWRVQSGNQSHYLNPAKTQGASATNG